MDEWPDNVKAKFFWLFEQMSEQGKVLTHGFKHEKEEIFTFYCEIKRIQYRMPCVSDGRKWIISHGFKKKCSGGGKVKWRESDFERVRTIIAEYYQ